MIVGIQERLPLVVTKSAQPPSLFLECYSQNPVTSANFLSRPLGQFLQASPGLAACGGIHEMIRCTFKEVKPSFGPCSRHMVSFLEGGLPKARPRVEQAAKVSCALYRCNPGNVGPIDRKLSFLIYQECFVSWGDCKSTRLLGVDRKASIPPEAREQV
ncbi:hypothetical protein CHS0354_037909 [Potamilus streckersoni]|uniref:Uncharacterized protein n=1 Tax=Potamilus streckersoni TaxID=2493646 RepID=A0AAE0TAD5_9BIVA|nr:hypothetical protein CHS0354_037909 [Potamilus streckersoni]